MGIFQKLADNFIAPLSEEQKASLQKILAEYASASARLESRYISRKESAAFTDAWEDAYKEVKKTKIKSTEELYPRAQNLLQHYKKLPNEIKTKNESFLKSEGERCNALLSDIDGKSLDPQQRRVVLCDEDRCLVLAGAGSGKTLTISGKVKYLCAEQGIAPEDILLISFTKKAAEEMTERIANRLGIAVQATTFHKLGLDIITEARAKRPDVQDQLDDFVRDYFEQKIVKNPKEVQNLIEFFACYLDIPAELLLDKTDSLGQIYEMEKTADFETIRSQYERNKYIEDSVQQRRETKRTLKNEQVKSLQEVSIANFLFLHGINYEYEAQYPFTPEDLSRKVYRPDFYLPDYNIYLEHFGIDRQGNVPWLSPIEEKKYQEDMEWKRAFHKQNETKLLETYSYYASEGVLLEKLEEMLKANGVVFKMPDFADIFETVYAKESDKYFSEFMKLCTTFITLFKSNGYKTGDMEALHNTNPKYQKPFFKKRTELFKSIVLPILETYEAHLAEQESVDFSDMINTATDLVEGGYAVHPYKWVIVDEYQDISVARYKLVAAILNQTGAKLLCVGDDWQSIYRFAGSDISLFTGFERYFGAAEIMRLEQTYRNSQQLIDEAGKFVMRNPNQFKKNLRSPKSLDYPITFMCYFDNPFSMLRKTLAKIISTQGPDASIMILGRTNYDFELLVQSGLFSVQANKAIRYKESPNTPIEFLTAHRSKGLEADNVIVLFQGGKLGFPNKISDDPVLELVLTAGDDFLYAEERRLLYVALTRTKNRVFLLADEGKPSEFLKEFQPSKSVFILSGKDADKEPVMCPRCKTGHLSVRHQESTNRYFVGCSNFPQCDYTVRDTSVLENPRYCPECGGFLVKRKGKYGSFFGCSNYPTCEYTEEIE